MGTDPNLRHSSLIIAPQWIGDAVMTEPLLRRLKARGERLTVGALPWVAPVYRAMPQVAQVIELPFAHGGLQLKARRALAQSLAGQFDVAYVLPNSLKSALLPLLAGIPKRVGYRGESRFGLLTHRLQNPPKKQRPPMVAFYSRLCTDIAVDIQNAAQNSAPTPTSGLARSPAPSTHNSASESSSNGDLTQDYGDDLSQDRPHLQIPDAQVAEALQSLALQRLGFYVFAPGAEYGPAKRWPAAHFAELARQLDLPVILLGSTKESALCDEIAAIVNAARPGQCLNLAGKTTLAQAFAAISAAKAVVSNDSGLMHVAAAFGVPQVAIFGSSSPIHTPPLSTRASVLWLKQDASYQPPLDCAPCFERECPLPPDQGHMRCLLDIQPQVVLQQLKAALQNP